MKSVVINNQYIFFLESNGVSLFYNTQNGQLALSDKYTNLDSSFFSIPQDISVGMDEIQYEQLYLAVSESCNFRCKYCRQTKTDEIVNMSFEDIKNAIDVFYKKAAKPKSIVFFGGEPLLNYPGIRYAVEYVKSFDNNIRFSMVINGSLCNEETAEFLSRNDVEVIVSLDGPEYIHNSARVNMNHKGTYQEALRGYQCLKAAGCITGITVVIGPHNENSFQDLIDWAIELQPHSLGFCLPHGDENNYAMKISSFDKIHARMLEAYDILNKNGIYLVQVEQKIAAFILGYAIPFECKACGKRIVACKEKKFGICEGPITNDKMFAKQIDELPEMVRIYKKSSPFNIPSCRSCIAYRICGGSCVYDKLTRFGRSDVTDSCRCGLNQMIAEKAMEKILDSPILERHPHIISAKERQSLFSLSRINF